MKATYYGPRQSFFFRRPEGDWRVFCHLGSRGCIAAFWSRAERR